LQLFLCVFLSVSVIFTIFAQDKTENDMKDEERKTNAAAAAKDGAVSSNRVTPTSQTMTKQGCTPA